VDNEEMVEEQHSDEEQVSAHHTSGNIGGKSKEEKTNLFE
jgi:hypothetical protein